MSRGEMRDAVWIGLAVLAALCGVLLGSKPSVVTLFAVLATGVLVATWYQCGRAGGDHERTPADRRP